MNLRNRITAMLSGLSLAMFAGLASAQEATLPASVSSGFDNISSQGSALFDLAVPVVMGILGSMIIIKLIKRFGNKV